MVAGAMGGAMGGAIGGAGMNMASAQQDAYQVEDCVSTQLFHTSPAFIWNHYMPWDNHLCTNENI